MLSSGRPSFQYLKITLVVSRPVYTATFDSGAGQSLFDSLGLIGKRLAVRQNVALPQKAFGVFTSFLHFSR
jgi:hypothetical protein